LHVLRWKKRWIAFAVLVLGGAVGVGFAAATVAATVLHDTHDVRLRIVRSEFVPSADQPTFTSGWHTHPGPVIVQVQEGYLKITQATCNPNVIGPGETYVETPELPVLATANKPVKWTTSMILPDSPPNPLATPASSPC
jgi:quercetin dioxygenase-like cupin family protein